MDLLPKLLCPRIFVFCINWESPHNSSNRIIRGYSSVGRAYPTLSHACRKFGVRWTKRRTNARARCVTIIREPDAGSPSKSSSVLLPRQFAPHSRNPSFDGRLSGYDFRLFVHIRAGEKRVLCVMSPMTSRRSFGSKALLILAFVCAISISTVAQASPPPGRVVVKRVPQFGWNLGFHLQIDGRSVATIAQGHDYDSWLPAGRHLLTVVTASYAGLPQPTSITVNVEPGRTYMFTAMWDSNLIFLSPAGVWLTPGKEWELRAH